MGREKKTEKPSKKRSKKGMDRLSLALTLIAVSAFAVFAGYLVGQYAVEWATGPLVTSTAVEGQGTRFVESDPPPSAATQAASSSSAAATPATQAQAASSPSLSPAAATPTGSSAAPATAAAPSSGQPSVFRVQVGHFSTREEATRVAEALKTAKNPIPDAWVLFDAQAGDYRVQAGAFSRRDRADEFVAALRAEGHDAYVAP